jgi:DNA repair exonuclease SbcCD ATPase subunit
MAAMNNVKELDKELAELKEFIADLKQDRAAQKEKERREAWTKYTAISLVFIAVLATVATQWSGKYSGQVLVQLNDSTFKQAQASDKWSYYQAKSIKQNLYEALRELAPKNPTADEANAAQSLAAFKAKVDKYESEKAKIKQDAEKLEAERDTAREAAARASKLGGKMGTAISVFQIAVALGSICLVTKKRPLWYLSLGLAGLATVRMILVWMA